MKYIRFQPEGLNSVIMPYGDIVDGLEGSDAGDKFTLEVVEMSEEEFKKLPEFNGF